jgi:hypothetical protein
VQYEIIISALSVPVPTLSSIAYLAYWPEKKFSEVDEMFRTIDERFRAVDEKLELLMRGLGS